MLQIRIIPVLLLEKSALVKSKKFKDLTYIGDPINAVRIFNDKEVDEIILLDITASKEQREPNFNLIAEIGSEAFVPFAYGGGIKNISQVRKIKTKMSHITSCAMSFVFQGTTALTNVSTCWRIC